MWQQHRHHLRSTIVSLVIIMCHGTVTIAILTMNGCCFIIIRELAKKVCHDWCLSSTAVQMLHQSRRVYSSILLRQRSRYLFISLVRIKSWRSKLTFWLDVFLVLPLPRVFTTSREGTSLRCHFHTNASHGPTSIFVFLAQYVKYLLYMTFLLRS